MTRFLAKALIVLATVAILAPAPLLAPRAHAAWPVVNTIDIPRVAEAVLKRAAIIAGRTAIQSMTRSIVNWINSGFNGSPAFERNLGVNLRRLADGVTADFVTRLATETTVNSPWLDRMAGNVAKGYLLYTSRDRLATRIEYTLHDYVTNAVAWRRGDFQQGGFNAWMSSAFHCGNDPYCAEFAAQEELINRIDGELRERMEELGWGRGFLSWKCDCEGGAEGEGSAEAAEGTPLNDSDESANCNICTPGSTLESAMGITATSPLRSLEVAESIDQILGALASQMVSQVFNGLGLYQGGGGGSDADRAQLEGTTLLSSLSASFIETAERDRDNVTVYRDSWTRIRDAATAAVAACGTTGSAQATEAAGVLAQANAAIAKAGRALDALSSIITRAETARGGSTSTLATSVTSDYNCLVTGGLPEGNACTRPTTATIGARCPVSSALLPRGDELTCATANAQDVEGTTPPTLLMRMNEIASSGCD